MKKIIYLDSIKSPVITEKATTLSEYNKVVFKFHPNASKSGQLSCSKRLLPCGMDVFKKVEV